MHNIKYQRHNITKTFSKVHIHLIGKSTCSWRGLSQESITPSPISLQRDGKLNSKFAREMCLKRHKLMGWILVNPFQVIRAES